MDNDKTKDYSMDSLDTFATLDTPAPEAVDPSPVLSSVADISLGPALVATSILESPSAQASSSAAPSPDLTAVKNLLLSNYSRVSHIFLWKKPIESGIIFAIGLSLIIALTFASIISVVAYTALGVVVTSGLIRAYKVVMKTLNKPTTTPVDHIWTEVLNLDVAMSPDRVHALVDSSIGVLNASMVYFKQSLLVEDKVATIKFASFLYLLTYIGSWFNGMTLITLIYLALFSAPLMYEKNQSKIDELVGTVFAQLSSVISTVTGKVTSLVGGVSGGAKKNE